MNRSTRRRDSAWVHSPDNVELNGPCPVCGADTGYSCRDKMTLPSLGRFHLGRLRALRAQAVAITKGGKGSAEVPVRIHPAYVLAHVGPA